MRVVSPVRRPDDEWRYPATTDRHAEAPAGSGPYRFFPAKRVSGAPGETPARSSCESPGRARLKGASGAVDALITQRRARDASNETPQKPRASAAGRRRNKRRLTRGKNGTWGGCKCGNASAAVFAEKAPKGESQERCRSETRSTRSRREQAIERVIKP